MCPAHGAAELVLRGVSIVKTQLDPSGVNEVCSLQSGFAVPSVRDEVTASHGAEVDACRVRRARPLVVVLGRHDDVRIE